MLLLVNNDVLERIHLYPYTPLLSVHTATGPHPCHVMYGASIRLLIAINSVRRLGKVCEL
jgi:hypothetical protein